LGKLLKIEVNKRLHKKFFMFPIMSSQLSKEEKDIEKLITAVNVI